jgi:hypothetical protein
MSAEMKLIRILYSNRTQIAHTLRLAAGLRGPAPVLALPALLGLLAFAPSVRGDAGAYSRILRYSTTVCGILSADATKRARELVGSRALPPLRAASLAARAGGD